MKMQLEWLRPVPLKDGEPGGLIYALDLKKLPTGAGVYVFGRCHGKNFEALYVGKATKISKRVKGQLNNLKLMRHLEKAKAGERIVLAGRFVAKRGQNSEKCIKLIERALIRHFLSEGHDLVNKQGTRLQRHEIASAGEHPKLFFPKLIYLEKRRGE